MPPLSTRNQILTGLVLAALMFATQGHHYPTVKQLLPSATWAVFFVAGVYLRPRSMLPVFLALAALLDMMAIGWGNVSDYCVSVAYAALIPAYGSLWFAGRWYARHHTDRLTTLPLLAVTAFAATVVCEIISSGSFYFYSGRFANPNLAEFAGRFEKYFPHSIASLAIWVAVAALIHALIVAMRAQQVRA
jgi:hypothetical protein